MQPLPPYVSRYIFELCSRSNWDGIAACYREVTSILESDTSKPSEKNSIRTNIKFLITYTRDGGNTPLHIACARVAPSDAIDYLLKLADMACLRDADCGVHQMVTSQSTRDGSTP